MVKNGKTIGFIAPYSEDVDVSTEAVIAGGGGFMATNSIFYPAVYSSMMDVDFFKVAPVGDAPTQAFLATKGTVHYLNAAMSAYRTMAKGSWSERTAQSSKKSQIELCDQMIKMYESLDMYYNNRYARAVKHIKNTYKIQRLMLKDSYSEILNNEELNAALKQMPLGVNLTVRISRVAPRLCYILKIIKRLILCR